MSVSRKPTGSLILVMVITALVGCGGKKKDRKSVQIDGSSTVYPISERVAEKFSQKHSDVRVTAGFSGTGGGFKKFVAGEIDICDASRGIKESEKEACKKAGVEYVQLEVAFDGLAVVVSPDNDWCDCLTVAQLKELWRPESAVKKWSDLDPKWPEEEIKLYGPGPDSGTFDYFTKAIVGQEKSSRSDYTPAEDDNVLVRGVQADKYALAYFGFAYYAANESKLKLLAVDNNNGKCIKPSSETVRDLSYSPLSRPLYIYVRKDAFKRSEIVDFVSFFLENAAETASHVKYVPVSDAVAKKNQEALKAAIAAVKE